jgi:hypothetical protein
MSQGEGFVVNVEGISQSAGKASVFGKLLHHSELGFNASIEIITDIYALSQCSTLVGMCASQIFRMAVGMSNCSGYLKYAVAMDYAQLNRVLKMSEKYGLPVPEYFDQPQI